jgi:hypothetical protein
MKKTLTIFVTDCLESDSEFVKSDDTLKSLGVVLDHMEKLSLDDGTVRRLDKLRAAVRRRTGRPISRGEVLDRLVEDAYDSRDEVVELSL